jgi:hypothetical protein
MANPSGGSGSSPVTPDLREDDFPRPDSPTTYKVLTGMDRQKNLQRNFIQFGIQLVKSAKENHSIELLMFFHMIGYTCTTVIVQNLYIDRICRISKNYTESICSNLTNNEDEGMFEFGIILQCE